MIKAAIVAFALVAGLVCVQAAGGIKGRQQSGAEGQFRFQSLKGPVSAAPRPTFQQQQQYTVQQQAPAPQFTQQQVAVPQFTQQQVAAPQFTQQQVAAPQFSQQSFAAQSVKSAPAPSAGVQLAPVFNAVRVQAAPAPQPIQQQVQVQEQEPEQQQQQAPDQEVDPSAAAQEGNAALAALARPAAAAASEEEANPRPEPYNFQYAFNSGDAATSGSSTREEQQDASGRVTGFYTLKGEDGRDRRVDYVADASGFRATISTNELGTANKDSADGKFNSPYPAPEPPQPISAAAGQAFQASFEQQRDIK
uniref:Adult-specific rigid cuticular protein 15.5 n=1 Tax=Aceria tosichella TaxID=561515 RepID=A0A6G1SNH4_9ACAR